MANLRVQRRLTTDGSERGASLVEFALIMPLLFLLLLGTITGGLTLSRHNSTRNAVREATRYGSVLPTFTQYAANLSELHSQAVLAATGDLNLGVPGRVVCVALIDENNLWRFAIYRNSTTVTPSITGVAESAMTPSERNACASNAVGSAGAGTRRVWVRAARESSIEALFFTQNVTIESRSLARYERVQA